MDGITRSRMGFRLSRRWCVLLITAAMSLVFGPSSPVAASAIHTVTNLNDNGAGSLRYAILFASAGDTINFAPNLSGTIALSTELDITKSMAIIGPGLTRVSISGGNTTRVMRIRQEATVTISGVWIRDGSAGAGNSGGGILNSGHLTLADAYVSNSSADDGAGIQNSAGSVSLRNVFVFFNNAALTGGGINNYQGTVDLSRVTLSANHAADGGGGGITNAGDGTVTMKDVAFHSNTATEGGGMSNQAGTALLTNVSFTNNSLVSGGYGTGSGISNGSPSLYSANRQMTLTNVTLSNNTAGTNGGALFNRGVLTNTNTTVAYNTNVGISAMAPGHEVRTNVIIAYNTPSNCHDTGFSFPGGSNLRWPNTDASCWGGWGDPDGDPKLGSLGRYDGSVTYMRPLLPGSAAIDHAWNAKCPSFDQRYMLRPVGAGCDIGAYELGYAVRLPLLRR